MVNSRFEGLLWFSERDHPVLQWEGQLSPVMEVEVEEEEEEEEAAPWFGAGLTKAVEVEEEEEGVGVEAAGVTTPAAYEGKAEAV